MTTLSEMGARSLKTRNELFKSSSSASSKFQNDNIFFNWGTKSENTFRIVGFYTQKYSHWIGPSSFGRDVQILDPIAFKAGENKIPLSVACANWDPETETFNQDGDCPVCRLSHNADKFIASCGKDMDKADLEIIRSIRNKCNPKAEYLWKVIDRDNPYLDDEKTRKGFKILRTPFDLWNQIIELSKSLEPVDITSPDKGIDIIITRSKSDDSKRGGLKYTAKPVYSGMSIKQTPLTEEELAYHDLDLKKFCGKPIAKERFEDFLCEDNNVKTIYELQDEEGSSEAPF